MDSVVASAERLARAAHEGQVDKAGMPYASHPARVAARVADDPACAAAAWLHDVLEDTSVTAADLRRHGIPEHVVAAVLALTRVDGEDPAAYYGRVAANPVALRVKLADLADNSDPVRLAALARQDPETAARLQAKYGHASRTLEQLRAGPASAG